MSKPESTDILGIRLSEEEKQLLRIEAAHEGISMSELARNVLLPTLAELRKDRLHWESRQAELASWTYDELDERADYLLSQFDERSLSKDEEHELDYISGLLAQLSGVTERIAEKAA